MSIPEEIWLSDALEHTRHSDESKEYMALRAELRSQPGEVRLYFDDELEVYKAHLTDSLQLEHDYYFIEGSLSYSVHKRPDATGSMWVMAWAVNKPYAAATLHSGGEWVSCDPTEAPSRTGQAVELVRLVEVLEQREHSRYYDKRIEGMGAMIADMLPGQIGQRTYAINTRKGETWRIKLQSDEPHVYFTLTPNNGSDMEWKTWEGKASITGDLVVRVFSLKKSNADQPFQLRIERL
jgi:hypothetical protein